MQKFNNRQQKIAFLQKLASGKASMNDLVEPIEGMVCVHNDHVFAYIAREGVKLFTPELTIKEFEANH